ncbi:MAG: hypothetical protein CMM01_04735 [Rhodopirellula sp.]|nr:hypothetical protein [Rhodopirellula sp.]
MARHPESRKVLLKFGKHGLPGTDRSVATGGEIGKLSRASSLAPLGELAAAPITMHIGLEMISINRDIVLCNDMAHTRVFVVVRA